MDNSTSLSFINRRKFIINTMKSAGGFALLGLHPAFINTNYFSVKKQMTVQDIIDLILREGNLSPIPNTVDTIKAGSGSQVVTGIVTTMFPTINVIEEAIRLNANFIIAHEPSFYNHLDDTQFVKNNSVLKQKQELLQKNNIAIWRFHDYCHSLKPDAISYGVVKKAGWLSYYKTEDRNLTIPKVLLGELVQHLKLSLGISHLRIIGDINQPCEKIALLPGASGGQKHISIVENNKPDVLIVGEVSEWETAEYIRDERSFGGKTALIILGHSASEEPGMEWVAEWLQPKIPAIKITHISSGDPFTWL
jgi:putative NIF3 family GTP cyclohydrolase 1 type 2